MNRSLSAFVCAKADRVIAPVASRPGQARLMTKEANIRFLSFFVFISRLSREPADYDWPETIGRGNQPAFSLDDNLISSIFNHSANTSAT